MTDPLPRVLFLVAQPFFRWRGSPIRVAYDVSALAESGYRVDLVTLPLGEPIDIPGVRIHRVGNPLRVRDIPIGPSAAKLFFNGLLMARARRLIREERPAAIHGVEECGMLAWWLARRCGARAVYEKHSDPASHRGNPLRNLLMRGYAAMERFLVRRVDMLIGTGPGLVEQAQRMGCRAPCHHVPDIPSSRRGADPDKVASMRAQWAGDGTTVLVTYVGSFAAYQGIDLLFDAIPEVARQRPGVRFVIIGGTPPQIAQRRAQLAAAGCERAVIFAGTVAPDQLPSWLAACDILLSPRVSGTNTPLKLLDYLKTGRAIVATDIAANRQILDPDNALFVEPRPAALAAGIVTLADDPERRRQLGQAGAERIRRVYNYEVFKTGLANAYAGLLGTDPGEPRPTP